MKNLFKTLLFAISLLPQICSGQEKLATVDLKNHYWYKNSIIYNLEVGVFKPATSCLRGPRT